MTAPAPSSAQMNRRSIWGVRTAFVTSRTRSRPSVRNVTMAFEACAAGVSVTIADSTRVTR